MATHETSPFATTHKPETKTAYRYVKAKDQELHNTATGDVLAAEFRIPYEKDAGRFSKLADEYLYALGTLSITARRCLDYVLYQLLPGNSIVYLPPAEGILFCRVNQAKSFYDAVAELIEANLLAKTPKRQFYHINTGAFFNGNRVRMRHEYTKPNRTFSLPTE